MPLTPTSKRARVVEFAVVTHENVLDAIDLLRPYLESLMLDGPVPVKPALIALCTKGSIETIKKIRSRAEAKRGLQLYESATTRDARAATADHVGLYG